MTGEGHDEGEDIAVTETGMAALAEDTVVAGQVVLTARGSYNRSMGDKDIEDIGYIGGQDGAEEADRHDENAVEGEEAEDRPGVTDAVDNAGNTGGSAAGAAVGAAAAGAGAGAEHALLLPARRRTSTRNRHHRPSRCRPTKTSGSYAETSGAS